MRPELIILNKKVDEGLLDNTQERIMHIRAYSGMGTGELTSEEADNLHRAAEDSRKQRQQEYLESRGIRTTPTRFEKVLMNGVSWLEKLVKG